jgi:hypothetical protein
MMLVLGVVDMPYVGPDTPPKVSKAKKGKANKPRKAPKAAATPQTTGEVATILEDKYQVMEHFVGAHMKDIQKEMIKSLEATIVQLNTGLSATDSPFEESNNAIKHMFETFLDRSEIEHMGVPGVPTQAAKDGVQSRYRIFKGPRRPSFIDSGQYQTASKVWVE